MAADHPQWRTNDGRFAETWQPHLRPDRPMARFELVPIDVWRAILAEANEPVIVSMEGRRKQRVTRLEAALLELGCNAHAKTARLRNFISAVKKAAYYVALADALDRKVWRDWDEKRKMNRALRRDDVSLWRYLVRRYAIRLTVDEPQDPKLALARRVYDEGAPAAHRAS
jgi:hypothetical protein